MFYFMLSPTQWYFDGDSTQIFRAIELADGNYLISWKQRYETLELIFTKDEVSQEIGLGHWIKTNQNGEWI